MLFPFKYIPHQMDKMQVFMDFIFYEVWCKARNDVNFSFELFRGNPELFEIMKGFYYSDKDNADFFYGHVERIYGCFACLKQKQIRRLKWWYCSNNDIKQVCANDPVSRLARYQDLNSRYPKLAKELYTFFYGLYDFEAAGMRRMVGDLSNHYKAFVKINNSEKCPFCGIIDLLGKNHSPREAYDHYLPKALYPFNSINFRNLVPACHYCNSSYKAKKDPSYTPKDPLGGIRRRKAFYPYAETPYTIDIQVNFQHTDVGKLEPADVCLTFGPCQISEEIDTWKDVYGIEERYKAKICSNDARNWLEEVRILYRRYNLAPKDYIAGLGEEDQFANCNFLKKPYLDACGQVGIFDIMRKAV